MTRTAHQNSYTRTLSIDAPMDRDFRALTSPREISAWWNATSTTGDGGTAGQLRITYGTESQPTVIDVLVARTPSLVVWDVQQSPLVPDWVGTRPTFTMTATPAGCRLDFAHHGLISDLDCYDRCAVDWRQFLTRIAEHATGC